MNVLRITSQRVTQLANPRCFSASATQLGKYDKYEPYLREHMEKVEVLRAKFQKEDGIPVYLKGGTKDKICYYISLVGTVTTTIIGLKILYDFAQKK